MMNKKLIIISLICKLGFQSVYADAQKTDNFPLLGKWKIISFQMMDSSQMELTHAQKWIGGVITFSENQTATLNNHATQGQCQKFTYQLTTPTTKDYFSKYQVNPLRLGIVKEQIQLVSMSCQVESWLGNHKEFLKVSEEQMLGDWNGVIFFFVKLTDEIETLLITPQSVGLLNSNSDFNQTTLIQALPSYTLKQIMPDNSLPGDPEQPVEYYKVYQDKQLKLKIYSNEAGQKITRIHIYDQNALAPNHAKIGNSYAEIFNKDNEQLIECQAGIKERNRQTICFFKEMPTIQYIFELKYDDNAGQTTPTEALNRAKLVEFIWTAGPTLINETSASEPLSSVNSKETPTEKVVPIIPLVAVDVETAYKIEEKRLNEIYNRLNVALIKKATRQNNQDNGGDNSEEPVNLTDFINAQQAWIKYRDYNCHWHASLIMDEVMKSHRSFWCLERMTRERADEMEQVLKPLEK